ncbi:hypothetical protein [Lactococcus petauri]|uniref:hypothetical protein n=1 Tax=Lactococcus petauri TaxID=1940789 RepID=UPI00254CF768|nr:hypothetical protein [Lactococcus petauri]
MKNKIKQVETDVSNDFALNPKLSPEVSSFYKQLPEYLLRIAPTNFTGFYRLF